MKLNIGCGRRPEKGATNLDMIDLPGVDVVHNLDSGPMPFGDEIFDEVRAEDVLEHVTDLVFVMDEIWRIMKHGATLWIRGPHGAYPEQLWRDPTHKRAFVPGSFDNWDPSTQDGKSYGHYFGKACFQVLEQVENNKGMEYLLRKP